MQKLLLGYHDNMRVEIEPGVPVTAKPVADLRALPGQPGDCDGPLPLARCCAFALLSYGVAF